MRDVKNNILITRDGRACLGDFGIVGAFGALSFPKFKLGTARYMALERLTCLGGSPSKKSDIYSLAMTSFTVCSSPVVKQTGIDTISLSILGPDKGIAIL